MDPALLPGTIGSLALPNRVIMGAMHLNLEGRCDGGAALAAFYAARARGGAGLIVTGGSAVNRVGAGGRHYSFVNEPEQHAMLARIATAVHAEGGRIALQLFHAGRYARPDAFGLTPIAPSAVYSRISRCTPEAASSDQVAATVADFARGAATAAELGFDAVEIMGSEGYLINQFLSPVTNHRDDEWGGDPVRRRGFALAVARAVLAGGAGLPVLFRLSGADLVPGGPTDEEPPALAVALADTGIHAIDVGIGWHESPVPTVQTVVPPGAWVPYARAVRERLHAAGHTDVPVVASNRINRMKLAGEVLMRGDADFVSLSRPWLADPDLVAKYRRDTAGPVNICIACNEACIDRSLGDEPVSCLVNPRAGHELEFVESGRGGERGGGRYAVLGAGPAGLEAARALAALGQRVEVFEAAEEIGGQFRMARLVPGKADFGSTIDYYRAELDRLGATIHCGRSITDRDGELLAGFDGAVLATGVVPRAVDLPGTRLPHVITYPEAFRDPDAVGRRVAIVGGGGIACDLAHVLGHRPSSLSDTERFLRQYRLDGGRSSTRRVADDDSAGRSVVLMRRTGKIGAGMGITTRWAVLDAVQAQGAELLTGVAYREITGDGVMIVDGEGRSRLIAADTVILAAGQEPENSLLAVLERLAVPYRCVGGAAGSSELNAVRATAEGLRAAHDLHTARYRVP